MPKMPETAVRPLADRNTTGEWRRVNAQLDLALAQIAHLQELASAHHCRIEALEHRGRYPDEAAIRLLLLLPPEGQGQRLLRAGSHGAGEHAGRSGNARRLRRGRRAQPAAPRKAVPPA